MSICAEARRSDEARRKESSPKPWITFEVNGWVAAKEVADCHPMPNCPGQIGMKTGWSAI